MITVFPASVGTTVSVGELDFDPATQTELNAVDTRLLAVESRVPELGYAQITSTFTTPDAAGDHDVTALTVTVTVGTRPIEISVCAAWMEAVGNLKIKEGATTLMAAFPELGGPVMVRRRLAPTAGSHTYKVTLARFSGTGTRSLYAAADAPASLHVVEV